ncbi:FliA/WhiG family RNA polymerase sigma factor [Thermanaerovibrio acidaminovorans]|uniref:RNA polymerase sigma factor n=1 Tax=Thermanaerovibrio acidaminovorans (strain ATCC 49978 / DSM 6589 / Su883) TaxID=525903 RepID=D1B696_THEAS|nr:FliA/WhiG family RNA polymerase sigma factor [Thermanaerovibrio acidaminovorans]ACZ19537.1 RNA polymerase, sigma 28 subunit, FliA/WhiG [Thermanaerovibrio acidaminovorans DSM 6589]
MRSDDAILWEAYAKEPTGENRERIVKRYIPLVKYVAGRMAVTPPPGLDYDDILSFGVMGLLDAMDRFDPSRGFCFQTFAVPRIRGAILDELRRYDWISRTGRDKLQRLERAMEEAAAEGTLLDDEALMERLGMNEKSYRELLEIASRSYVVSLDEVLGLEDGEVKRDGLLEDPSPSPQEEVERREELALVRRALEELPERERLLLSLYYQEGLTLKEVGAVLGVTESRASQLHGRAIAMLRSKLL